MIRIRFAAIAAALLAITLLAGCSSNTADKGAMKVGIRATSAEAALKVDDQPGVTNELKVASVKAPEAAWLVVHLDDGGKPGPRIGLLNVPKGVSQDLTVPLKSDKPLTDKLIVAVHADRATPGSFDFVMDKFDASPDKPFWVDGKELATFIQAK